MPIATPEIYADMLDRAKAGGFAYPAINCTSSETINAALKGFADAGSDGIIQISTGGAEFGSGLNVKDMVTGAVALAEFAHVVAAKYDDQRRAAHRPLPEGEAGQLRPAADRASRRSASTPASAPLFQSHMWDGSAIELEENLQIAAELLAKAAKARIILELEIGVVGGEEDGVHGGDDNEKLYTTPGDAMRTAEVLGTGEKGRYILAATFGNVHGSYKPGSVKLRPEILKEIQDEVGAKVGKDKPFDLVFHGGSGSELDEIREAVVLRRGEDERRHRHAVRVHPRDRRAHVHQLRRRAQGRRRGRQQEGLRPALLPEAGRGRHGRARRRRPARRCSRPARPRSA